MFLAIILPCFQLTSDYVSTSPNCNLETKDNKLIFFSFHHLFGGYFFCTGWLVSYIIHQKYFFTLLLMRIKLYIYLVFFWAFLAYYSFELWFSCSLFHGTLGHFPQNQKFLLPPKVSLHCWPQCSNLGTSRSETTG